MEFYRRRQELGAQTEEQCTHILLQMATEGYPIKLDVTEETKEEYVKRLAKTKRILSVKRKKDEHKKKGTNDSGEAGTHGN